MLPTVDAVASVLKKYKMRATCENEMEIASELVHDSGLSTDYKGRIVVTMGDDSVGGDEEIVCKGARNAISAIAREICSQ